MDVPALRTAIELSLMPSRVRALRDGPLPDGVNVLLRIAAGDEEAERQAVASLDRPSQVVRDASTFFIEQMLLFPDADSYRVLGADHRASSAELRQNMALLIRWLHPDKNTAEERTIFVNRVNRAWDDLKTSERRSAYDLRLAHRPPSKPARTTASRSRGAMLPGEHGRRSGPPRDGSMRRGPGPGVGPGAGPRPLRRQLHVDDLLGPPKNGKVGIFRRLVGYLLRPRT